MSVPTNLIPTKITGLPEYTGSSQLGYFPYAIDGTMYKVQFSNVASVGEVPPSRTLTAGTGLVGGGDLSANRVFAIANGGVGASQLDTTGVVAGVYGNGSNVPRITVDANGRVTSVTTSPVVATGYVPEGRLIIAGTGLTGGGSLANNVTLSVNLASATPQALGTATAGVSTAAAREDHVHPAVDLSDTNETQGALPLGRGGTGDALSPVAGAVVYSTGTKFALTNPGIIGQVLTSTGTDEPVWTTLTGTGTVTSVNASGGTTGMTFTGGPITTVGTLTLGGTLSPDNGGTGLTATPTNGQLPIGNGTGYALSTLTAGTAVSITNGVGSITIDNTAPDRIVSLTGAGTTSISGTYPNFTITSNDQFDGTVTSVAASGGSTGLTFSGSPITSAGTLTLGGTLSATSGGTGLSAAPANGQLAIGNGTGYSLSTITAGSGVSVTNAAGSITIDNTAPDQIVSLTAGTAISVTGTYPSFTVTNTAPDQIVSLTGAGTTSISGTYPNFTITSNDQFIGTVTSVAASGGATGLTFSGSPITSAGTLTLSGTLAVASGGTGATNAGAARTALGAAASGANTDITSIALTSGTIQNAPTSGTDIVNKAYADSIASGINFHQAVRLATVAALPAYTYNNGSSGVGATITANANGALSLDGVAVVAGNRVLIKDEIGAAQAYHGVYVVTQTGSGSTPFILTRATDFDSTGTGVDQIDAGDFFLVTAGATLANTSWVQQTPLPITVGTTPIIFSQFGAPVLYTAGTGLSLAGTVFSITNTGVSANTYGSASSVPVIAVNAQGQITSASSTSISIAASQITSGAVAVGTGGTGLTATPTNGQLLIGNGTGYSLSTLTAGTGVSVTNGSGSVTVTNTAPDQIVTLTGAGATVVTGTYPNFTITSTAGTGTVTSVAASGGTTGLTFSGSPITTSGTLTLGGTLAVANGGTGATSLSSGFLLRGNGTSPVSSSVIFDNGTNVGIGTTSPAERLSVVSTDTYQFSFKNSSASSTGAIGYSSADNMLFYGNGSERMRITAAGGLAVGTTTDPGAGNIGLAAGARVQFSSSAYITPENNVSGAEISTPGVITFRTGSGTPERMRLTSGGNLLVGTTVNYSRLTVSNGNSTRSGITISDANTASLMMFAGASSNAVIAIDTNNLVFQTGATAGQDNGTERMRITSAGDVGIGTSSPGATLTVVTNTTSHNGMRVTNNSTTQFAGSGLQMLGPSAAGSQGGAGIYYYNTNVGGTTGGLGIAQLNSSGNFQRNLAYYDFNAQSWAFLTNSTERLTINSSGNVTANVDIRAPIYYDLNNTAFYLDPASTSVTNVVRANAIQFSNGNTAITLDNSSYNILRDPTGSIRLYLGGADPANYYDNDSHFFRNRANTVMAQITGSGVFAPIFYDLNNTGYYLDPTSNTSLRTVGSWRSDSSTWDGEFNGKIQYHDNSWYIQYGNQLRLRSAGVGDIFWVGTTGIAEAAADMRAPIFYDRNNTAYYGDFASTSILRGLTLSDGSPAMTFSSTSSGRSAAFGMTDAFNMYLNAPAGGVLFLSTFRAPLFQDSDNTAFFVDPNSTSVVARLGITQEFEYLGSLNADYNSGYYHFSNTQNTPNGAFGHAHIIRLNADWNVQQFWGTGTAWDFWFRKRLNGSYAAWQFVMTSTLDSWNTTSEGQARFYFTPSGRTFLRSGNGFEFRSNTDANIGEILNGGNWIASADMRAPIFYDSNNTGFYLDPTGLSFVSTLITAGNITARGDLIVGEAGVDNASYIYMQDADEGQRIIHCNSNRVGFLNQSGGWGSWCEDDGAWATDFAVYSPIFYDRNNTAYYLDPAGTSFILGNFYVARNGNSNDTFGGLEMRENSYQGAGTGAATEAPGINFHWSMRAAARLYMDAGGNFVLGGQGDITNNRRSLSLNALNATGNVTAFSDIRVKDNIEQIEGALDRISRIRGVTYTRTDLEDTERRYGGVIAQEIEQVLPEAIFERDDWKAVDYNATIGLLIEAVKELTARVAELEGK